MDSRHPSISRAQLFFVSLVALLTFLTTERVYAAPPPSSAATDGAAPTTLGEYIKLARSNPLLLEFRNAEERNYEWQKFRAEFIWIPSLAANSVLSVAPAAVHPGDFAKDWAMIKRFDLRPVFLQTATLVMPLYGFGRGGTMEDIAESGLDAEKVKTEMSKQDREFDVRVAYAGLQLYQELQQNLETAMSQIQTALDALKSKETETTYTPAVKNFRKLQLLRTEIEAYKLDNESLGEVSSAKIAFLTGAKQPFVATPLHTEKLPSLPPEEQLVTLSKKHGLEQKLLGAEAKMREAEHTKAFQEFFPVFAFIANVTYVVSGAKTVFPNVCRETQPDGPCEPVPGLRATPLFDPLDQLSVNLLIGMRWEFDFSLQYSEYKRTEALATSKSAEQRMVAAKIDSEIKGLRAEVSAAQKKMVLLQQRRDDAKKWYDQVAADASYLEQNDYADAVKAYVDATVRHSKSVFDYIVHHAKLAHAVGTFELTATAND